MLLTVTNQILETAMDTTVPLRGKLSQYCTGKYSQLG